MIEELADQNPSPAEAQELINRHLWELLLCVSIMLSVSCTTSPKVERRADGSYVVDMGGTIMASRTGIVAEVKTREGDHLKFVAKGEDSTKVPTNFLRTAATALAGYFWSEAAQAAEVTTQVASKEATKLGTVQSNNATAVAIEGIKAETAIKTFVPP